MISLRVKKKSETTKTVIRSILKDMDWESFMTGTANDSWIRFRDLLHSLIAEHIPLKILSTKNVRKPMWMTHKAFKQVIKKRKIYSKYKDAQHPAVKASCKAAKSEIRKSRKTFEQKLAQNIKQDLKSFYAYDRNKTKCKVQVGPIIIK